MHTLISLSQFILKYLSSVASSSKAASSALGGFLHENLERDGVMGPLYAGEGGGVSSSLVSRWPIDVLS